MDTAQLKPHSLSRNKEGYKCSECFMRWTEKPNSNCYGTPLVPIYEWNERPENLRTPFEIIQMKLKPRGKPKGVYIRKTDHEKTWLYDINEAIPPRSRSIKQLEVSMRNLEKAHEKRRQLMEESKAKTNLRYCYICHNDLTNPKFLESITEVGIFELKNGGRRVICSTCASKKGLN